MICLCYVCDPAMRPRIMPWFCIIDGCKDVWMISALCVEWLCNGLMCRIAMYDWRWVPEAITVRAGIANGPLMLDSIGDAP